MRLLIISLLSTLTVYSQSATITLNGTVSDDGLPAGNSITIAWAKVSGPGTVTFASPSAAVTAATFSAAGVYVLRLSASDGELSAFDDVTVNIAAPANKAPVVNAGPDQSAVMAGTTLRGIILDDGKPSGQLTAQWRQISGPNGGGVAQFGNPFSAITPVSFSKQGNYVLRLTASDSQLSASDDILVAVVRK